jgi:acetyl esterase
MPVDPQVQRLLDLVAELSSPEPSLGGLPSMRAFSHQRTRGIAAGPDAHVQNRELAGPERALPIRIYRPLGSEGRRLPALVYLHGGGFVIGSIDQSDADCRWLATGVACAVINVEYALAPEHPFPAGLEDAYCATRWVHEHADELEIDPARIALAGDSAGGNLAAGVAVLARDRRGPPLVFQLLIYPVADLSRFDTESYRDNAEGYLLTRSRMLWFASQYFAKPTDARNPLASLCLCEQLLGLPPALVITAEYDPLRDEGEAYARNLERAGVPVQLSRYPGMVHGFFAMSVHIDAGKRALAEAIAALRRAFGS